jgi:protein O-GlcNAc transferase
MTGIGRAKPLMLGPVESGEIDSALAVARRHIEQGKVVEAEGIFRLLVERYAANPAVLLRLGDAAAILGQVNAAAHFYRCALTLRSDLAEAHAGLGSALVALHEYDDAIASCRRAIALKPRLSGAHLSLGAALFNKGGDLQQAEIAIRRAITLEPGSAIARFNLGNVLMRRRQYESAVASFRHALQIAPGHIEARSNLCLSLAVLGRREESIAGLSAAIESHPNVALFRINLGNVLSDGGRLTEAADQYERAQELAPGSLFVLNNLGACRLAQARPDDAAKYFRAALDVGADLLHAGSNLLFGLNYVTRMSAEEIFAAHRDWGRKFEAECPRQVHANAPEPERPLRVGYVSPDFRTHSCAYFIEPLFAAHDQRAVEIYCYSDVAAADETTERLRGWAGTWRDVVGLADDALTKLILEDRIDILVDLAGHTRGSRLRVFAGKAAPIQVSWLGYPNTTGLAAIDYRLTDGIADPPGSEHLAVERLHRLPQGFLCYRPPVPAPDVVPPPSERAGHVMFGSFNALPKISDETIASWSSIVGRVPGSRLFVKAKALADAATAAELRRKLSAAGVPLERVEITGWHDDPQHHLAQYGAIDIALDTAPYNGTTTTLEALWMGVPVVTRRGDRHAARVSASILEHAGLHELVAETPAHYVDRAVALAGDASRLAALRASMRARLAASPLRDEAGFARAVEAAYRTIWREWCATETSQRGK